MWRHIVSFVVLGNTRLGKLITMPTLRCHNIPYILQAAKY